MQYRILVAIAALTASVAGAPAALAANNEDLRIAAAPGTTVPHEVAAPELNPPGEVVIELRQPQSPAQESPPVVRAAGLFDLPIHGALGLLALGFVGLGEIGRRAWLGLPHK